MYTCARTHARSSACPVAICVYTSLGNVRIKNYAYCAKNLFIVFTDGKHSDFYRRNVYMSREDNVYVPVFTNPFYKYDSRSDSYLSLVGDMQVGPSS